MSRPPDQYNIYMAELHSHRTLQRTNSHISTIRDGGVGIWGFYAKKHKKILCVTIFLKISDMKVDIIYYEIKK
jgi:hypothetical protein